MQMWQHYRRTFLPTQAAIIAIVAFVYVSSGRLWFPALFMLVIGIGTQWILRAQHPRRREHPLPDPERTGLARGLRTTAWVGTLVAIGCAMFAYLFLPRLGRWIQLIPAGMILTAIMFVMFARGWDREGAGHK